MQTKRTMTMSKIYEFTVTIIGDGENEDEAWNTAVVALSMDPGPTPDEFVIVEDDDEEEIQRLKDEKNGVYPDKWDDAN
jgi:hypothetical protein